LEMEGKAAHTSFPVRQVLQCVCSLLELKIFATATARKWPYALALLDESSQVKSRHFFL